MRTITVGLASVVLLLVSASSAHAAFQPITSITAVGESGSDSILLTSATVGSYTVGVANLQTGTSWGTYIGSAEPPVFPVENADDFNLTSFASLFDPHDVVLFGGELFQDTNGANPDFFFFENGGNDDFTIQAILPDDTLGQALFVDTSIWGGTGFISNSGGHEIHGTAFSVSDLLDATGSPLDPSAVIKGFRISSPSIDPGSIAAVVPEPGLLGLLGFAAGAGLLLRRRS